MHPMNNLQLRQLIFIPIFNFWLIASHFHYTINAEEVKDNNVFHFHPKDGKMHHKLSKSLEILPNLAHLLETSMEHAKAVIHHDMDKYEALKHKKQQNNVKLSQDEANILAHHALQALMKSGMRMHRECELYEKMEKMDFDCISNGFKEFEENLNEFIAELHGSSDVEKYLEILKIAINLGKNVAHLKQLMDDEYFPKFLKAMFQKEVQKLKNVFMSEQLFDKASLEKEILENALEFHEKLTFFKKHEIGENAIISEYNQFAKFIDRSATGLKRDLYGQIHLNNINEKHSWLNKNTFNVIKLLLEEYYRLGLKPKDFIKMRGKGHFYLDLGLFEYEFLYNGAHIGKFNEDLDEIAFVDSPLKARPIAGLEMVDLHKANDIFWQMVAHGWNSRSYDHDYRKCRTFVYNFVCRLLDGECPEKDKWPQNFLEFDGNHEDGSVFTNPELLMPDTIPQHRNEKKYRCTPNENPMEIRVNLDQTTTNPNSPPPLLQYDTNIIMGFKRYNPNQPGVNESVGKILVDVIEEKTVETNRHHFTMYKANVKAFECKPTEMGILEYGKAAHMFLDTPTLLLDNKEFGFAGKVDLAVSNCFEAVVGEFGPKLVKCDDV